MNDQTNFTRSISVSVEDAVVLSFETELSSGAHHVGRKRIARPDIDRIAERRPQSCQTRLRTRQLAKGSRLNEEFLAVFSHEVRGSLGAINNAAQLLRSLHVETSAGDKARLLIERQVGRMTRLVDDLVDVSRTRSAELPLQREQIDLCVVVMHAIETVESDLTARNHTLTNSLPDLPIWLKCDPARLEQVLVNLLVNAAKYTDDGGTVSLSVSQVDDEAIVRIRDSGIGIAADVLPCVFNLFMQADHSSRRAEAGLGIGLALVRRLVELHGGSVTAASAGLGQGSEFTVRLPIYAERL
jgi:signal transduction histidine kinase